MPTRGLLFVALACLLAACDPPVVVVHKLIPVQAKPVASLAPAALASQLPKQVSLTLPASLVASGAGNYHALAAASPGVSLASALHDQLGIYQGMTRLVEDILAGVAKAKLPPDTPATFPDDSNPDLTAAQKLLPENQFTAQLTLGAGYGVVAVYQGAGVDPQHEICAIRYTSPTKGHAVLRPEHAIVAGTQGLVATTFDLDLGEATADCYFTRTDGSAAAWRSHAEYRRLDQAKAGQPTFTLRLSAYGTDTTPANAGLVELSANCLGDTGAAGFVGVIPKAYKAALGTQVVFAPSDGSSPDPKNAAPHALYVGPDGKDLPAASAPAGLQAIVPADQELQQPYMLDPQDPANGDPKADPAFAFPR